VSSQKAVREGPLRRGDVVEVKSAAEILATLDGDASTDAMPFMPEMLQFVGKRFTVSHRVEKICDTVSSGNPPNSRRMHDAVYLEDLSCDGSGHGGCQARCRIYWKEAWLRRVDAGPELQSRNGGPTPLERGDLLAQLEELARDGAHTVRDLDGAPKESYRCQATDALRATEPMSVYDPRQYIRELNSGNVGLARFLRVALRALTTLICGRLRLLSDTPLQPSGVLRLIRRRLQLLGYQPLREEGVTAPPRGELNLREHDTVEVRSLKEIEPTLDKSGRTRGLTFDWEMVPYCGGRYPVEERVERIIDERTGQMLEISSDCLILKGVVCSGEHSRGRWFCPREVPPYWREAWLRPVENAEGPASPSSAELEGA
jgi:hypothetical protein